MSLLLVTQAAGRPVDPPRHIEQMQMGDSLTSRHTSSLTSQNVIALSSPMSLPCMHVLMLSPLFAARTPLEPSLEPDAYGVEHLESGCALMRHLHRFTRLHEVSE